MITANSKNSFNCYSTLVVEGKIYNYFSLNAAATGGLGDISHMPCAMRLMLENLLRQEDDKTVTVDDIRAVAAFHAIQKNVPDIPFTPTRLLLNESQGLSALTDLAALRDTISNEKDATESFPPSRPIDIVMASTRHRGPADDERLTFLKWGEKSFQNIRLVPPEKGYSSQINMDVLSSVITLAEDSTESAPLIIPDTVLGTSANLPVINSLGVMGWRIDTMEAENIILGGQASLSLPSVHGVKIIGRLRKRITGTDIGLALAYHLRQNNGAGKIIEFYGPGLDHLTIMDRAMLTSYALSCGALCALFPIDQATIQHLSLVGHAKTHVALVEAYAREQGLWRESKSTGGDEKKEPTFNSKSSFSLDHLQPVTRSNQASQPLDLADLPATFEKLYPKPVEKHSHDDPINHPVHYGDVLRADIGAYLNVIAPLDLVVAGLLARNALAYGLHIQPWVSATLSLDHPVIETFLKQSGLDRDFERLGFHKLRKENSDQEESPLASFIKEHRLAVCSLSSAPHPAKRPFSALCCANYILSPSYIVAYAIVGSFLKDLGTQPLGLGQKSYPILLKDLWPSPADIRAVLESAPLEPIYKNFQESLNNGPAYWETLQPPSTPHFPWRADSFLIKKPPFLDQQNKKATKLRDLVEGRLLAIFGDNVKAADIAPEGPIPEKSPVAYYLATLNLPQPVPTSFEFFSGNYEIMLRGAFLSEGLENFLLPEGNRASGQTIHAPTQKTMPYFRVAENYSNENTPIIVFAGSNFGEGRGQEWSVKSLRLLGVCAVIAQSFDPFFRLNLIRAGVLPLQLKEGVTLQSLNLSYETFLHFAGLSDMDHPPIEIMMTLEHQRGVERYMLLCKLNTAEELQMYRHGSLWASALKKQPIP